MAFSTNNSSDEKGGSGGDDNGNGTSPSLRPQQQQQQQQQQDKEQQPTVPTKGASAHGAEFSSEKPLAQQQAGASQQTGGVGVGPDTTSNTTSSGGNATMGGSISAPKGPGWQALKGDEDEAVVGGGGVVAEQRVAAAASAGPDEDDEDDDTTSNKKKGRGSSDAVAVQHERGTSHHLMMPYTDAVSPASAGGAPARPASLDVGSATPEVFKVYKRRWFGLVQLTLLNIIASWDITTAGLTLKHASRYVAADRLASPRRL
ncbi:hypothetical protein B0T26DRAFT_417741 [Lasiosphaeria miniovina]|uniref:Uncharacterized protein n=1 Tax=Lasiosphaeria miniovina TaxID=1954250 RepID=A0AA40DMZ6_9PEZI|nr:uncharacterized protein B0T26DRAFT_417741 [Lasiosphaeria miniovina]KAK0709684.1 hypothetical protein B0T26DRAFT_417741 [Lasiosphaeria miniovina]